MLFVTHDLDEAVFLGERVVIMNPRPGHIRNILPIDLPFPRKRSSTSFQELRRLVLSEFEKVEEPKNRCWSWYLDKESPFFYKKGRNDP